MKILLCIGLSSLIFSSVAQTFSPMKKELVAAENAFASLAKERNTRDAFVDNLGDSSIVFERGNPVLGREVWMKNKPDNTLLFWWPVFSDVSASGDFGYNTGPFEWSADRSGAKPQVHGYFSSVWKKGKDGAWKVAIDMGMGMPNAEGKPFSMTTSKREPTNASSSSWEKPKEEIVRLDKSYVERLNQKAISFITDQLSDEARIHRTGHFPLTTVDAINNFSDSRENYHFEHLGSDIASSGDLAYTYGRVNSVNKTDKKQTVLNYLRIWKKEEGKNWKIVLDVIGG